MNRGIGSYHVIDFPPGRRAVLSCIDVHWRKHCMAGITAVGMFGKGLGGWGIAPTAGALELVVGGIAWKPAVVEGRAEPREILDLMTVVFDHDVNDGAPAARFTRRFVERIESGYGL